MTRTSPLIPLPLRIQDDLRVSLRKAARANSRTLNEEIVAILEAAMVRESEPRPLSANDMEEIRKLVEDLTRRAVEQARATSNVGYLSVDELGDLVGCKSNQRSKMIAWLTEYRWKFEVSSAGVPRVARLYHDRKLGIADGPVNSKLSHEPYFKSHNEPNYEAFTKKK